MSRGITIEKLKELLELHYLWLEDRDKGKRLDLSGKDLTNPEIIKILRYADLNGANLRYADLRYADLYGADLNGAKNIPFIRLACPDTGSFIGWKKVKNYIVKLEIPEDAKRCSATTNKCRCEFAKVLEIQNMDGSNAEIKEIENTNYTSTAYKVGEMVYPDSFDENRWNECSNGIHFFINRQDAIDY